MKALIAGGGIGGVTAALCLLDAGIDVELYERTSVFSEVGAVLLAWFAPVSWSRSLRVALLLVAAALTVFLTGALFGIAKAAMAGLAVALVVYVGLRRA